MTSLARSCVIPAYEESVARVTCRATERLMRLRCAIMFCEACDGYHVVYDNSRHRNERIDETHLRILEMLAMGMRDYDIGVDLNLTRKQVSRAVARLMVTLNAFNRPNLIAICITLGIINPSAFVPALKE